MNEALWALGRGTGVVALVMFTLSIVLGIVPARAGRCPAWAGSAPRSCTGPPP